MTKKKPESILDVDPTLPTTEIEIDGKTYRMCFDLFALAQAERDFIRQGIDVDILSALPQSNLNSTLVLFAASIHKFHPEVAFEDAQRLVTIPKSYEVRAAVVAAWNKSLPLPSDEGKGNPTVVVE